MAKLLTEFLGVFFLVLVVALTGNPLAIGVVLMVCVFMWGHISGAHYNPAVSLGIWLQKKMSLGEMFQYRWAQMLWGIVAVCVGWYLTGSPLLVTIGEWVSLGQAILVETLFTWLLVLVIYNVAIDPRTTNNQFYGLAIGFTILAAAYAGGGISWGAFNPAVWLSSMIVWLYEWLSVSHRWLYLVGPMLGGVLAYGVYEVQKVQKVN